MKQIRALLVVLSIGIFSYSNAWSSTSISRGTYDINIGDTLDSTENYSGFFEVEDSTISLYEEFGFGSPEKLRKINKKLGLKFYSKSTKLPDDVKEIKLKTMNGEIYEIAIYYTEEYATKISWEVIANEAIGKYGQPYVYDNIKSGNSLSYKWFDGIIELTIRKNGRLNESKTIFTTADYHIFYEHIPTKKYITESKKIMEEESRSGNVRKPTL